MVALWRIAAVVASTRDIAQGCTFRVAGGPYLARRFDERALEQIARAWSWGETAESACRGVLRDGRHRTFYVVGDEVRAPVVSLV
jgi:hypothetical protein